MSSTNRGAERAPADSYQTPPELAQFLVERLVNDCFLSPPNVPEPRVLEPSAGDGAFVEALAKIHPSELYAMELHHSPVREAKYRTHGAMPMWGDFESLESRGNGLHLSAVVGNPPYSLAERHIRHALTLCRPGATVAFLLRLAFLESRSRLKFWEDFPAAKVYVLAERPSFTGGKTDSSAYGFFVWRAKRRPKTQLEIVSWKNPFEMPRGVDYDPTKDLERLGQSIEELEALDINTR